LKPANILLLPKEEEEEKIILLKICDFGVSHILPENEHEVDLHQNNQIEGDGLYLAPEAMNQKLRLKSDIWSLGMLLLALYSGKVVKFKFEAGKSDTTIPSDLARKIPPKFLRHVQSMIHYDDAKRPTASEVRDGFPPIKSEDSIVVYSEVSPLIHRFEAQRQNNQYTSSSPQKKQMANQKLCEKSAAKLIEHDSCTQRKKTRYNSCSHENQSPNKQTNGFIPRASSQSPSKPLNIFSPIRTSTTPGDPLLNSARRLLFQN